MTRARTYLHGLGIVNALGSGTGAVADALFAGSLAGMKRDEPLIAGGFAPIGRVDTLLPPLPTELAPWDSRNNRLLALAVQQLRVEIDAALSRHGPKRIGIVLGTSTSGILEGEQAVRARMRDGAFPPSFDYRQQEISSPSEYLHRALGVQGPAYTVSTACTSSAKAFASARRLLTLGVCDAVIAGGVDTLCRLTVNGFAALESVAAERCNPMSANRDGIALGEAAAVSLLSREPSPIALLGVGESSDAYHISGPDPEGRGAELAMRGALADAGLAPRDVHYLNLHGTATPQNDLMESHAVARVFGTALPCSSTKPMVGHTLGAAGATELAFCLLTLAQPGTRRLPPHLWDGVRDPALAPLQLVTAGDTLDACRVAASNSFAFGGSNATLILGT